MWHENKQMTDVKLLVLHSNTWNHSTVCKPVWDSNTWNHLTVYKRISLSPFKNVSTKWIYKSYISNVYVKAGIGIK